MFTDTNTFETEKCRAPLQLQLHSAYRTYTTIAAKTCCTPRHRFISICYWAVEHFHHSFEFRTDFYFPSKKYHIAFICVLFPTCIYQIEMNFRNLTTFIVPQSYICPKRPSSFGYSNGKNGIKRAYICI